VNYIVLSAIFMRRAYNNIWEVMGDMGGDDGCKKRFRVEQRS